MIREDFAGPGGWDQALRALNLGALGIEINEHAAATAKAAGHQRIVASVLDCREITRDVSGYIGSPPCPTFSRMGNGDGVLNMLHLRQAIRRMAAGLRPEVAVRDLELDPRTLLVLEPLYVIGVARPRWVALEQVPSVLPLWEEYVTVLRGWGYSATCGVLTSEAYGVPQVRRRAILVAAQDRHAQLPPPSHSRFHARDPERLDPGVHPYVTVAAALGWEGRMAELWAERLNNQSGTAFDEEWPLKRPASTVAGRPMLTMPGANANRFNGSTKSRNDGLKITVAEMGVLQSFPRDYPWQGNQAKRAQQAGDAIPPLMAEAILRELVTAPAERRYVPAEGVLF